MISTILLLLSLVCFVLAAANVNVRAPVQMGWLGLALWMLTLLLGRGM